MANWVKFYCYVDGNISMNEDGVGSDRGPKTQIMVDVGTKLLKLEEIIAEELEIDLELYKLEINHRHPMTESDRRKYVFLLIKNDKDVFLLIHFAMEFAKGETQQLFINKVVVSGQGSILSVNNVGNSVSGPVRLIVKRSQPAVATVELSQVDSNSGLIPLFDDDSYDTRDHTELEVPLQYYQQSGGNGYINFEEVNVRGGGEWSFSDELKKGMRWNTKNELIHAVKMHHIVNHRDFKVVISTKSIWSVKCVLHDSGCIWRLRASKKRKDHAFEISIVEGPHTCVNSVLSNDHAQLDSNLLAQSVDNHVRAAPDVAVSVIRTVVVDKFGYDVTWKRTYEAKKKALINVYGDWDDSYAILPHLLNAIREANEGTVVDWVYSATNTDGVAVFERVFWSFGPCIQALQHIRPVISIDGTFLYGKFKHKLLIACGMDEANHIVPLAFALVDEESRASWSWFLICLKKYVVKEMSGPFCLISDRHVGIRPKLTIPRELNSRGSSKN